VTDRVLIYERRYADSRLFIALNFGDEPVSIGDFLPTGAVLLSTYLDGVDRAPGELMLRSVEGVIIQPA
jgi:hypothetical protein